MPKKWGITVGFLLFIKGITLFPNI